MNAPLVALTADHSDITLFADAMFKHASGGAYVSLRAFPDAGSGAPVVIQSVKLDGCGSAELVSAAILAAERAAAHQRATVFCPPLATFSEAKRAREQDLCEAFALSVECDQWPARARTALWSLLGEPTCVVESGGEWINPDSGEIEPKLHLHWRLNEPARGDSLPLLKEARRLAAMYVGGDPSNIPMVHPIRWPGSVHRKGPPKLARIVGGRGDAEIDLHSAIEALREAVPISPPEELREGNRGQPGPDQLIGQIMAGDSYHEPLARLAAHYVGLGMSGGAVVTTLRGFMNASQGPRDVRWMAREQAIPRLVSSAESKFRQEASSAANAANTSDAPAYVCNRSGDPKPILANAAALLRSRPEWAGTLGFDEFSGRNMILRPLPTDRWAAGLEPRLLGDADIRAVIEWVQRNGVTAAGSVIHEAVLKFCDETRIHPVKDYLSGLVWDGRPRLETFLIEHAGAGDTPLNRAISSRWMIQAIARIYEPGCQADATLILEGAQGIGKSSLLRILFGRWYTETLPELGSKDAMLQLRGVWCVELAELATLGRADQNRIKAFLTTNQDQYRAPYGRTTEWVRRSNVFAGTVNPGAGGYLKDATGARRFWPIEIPGPVDRRAIADNRDQIWAEARHCYRAGAPWHLDDPALIGAAVEAQSERFECDPWEESILQYVDGKPFVTVRELLGVLEIDPGRQSQVHQTRVAKILTHNGWGRKQKRIASKPRWGYVLKGGVGDW